MEEETSPREQFLASQEILSTIEWIDVLQDHASATEAMSLFNMHMSILLEGTSLFAAAHTRVHRRISSTFNTPLSRTLEAH